MNRGIYIQIIEKGVFQDRIYFSVDIDYYTFIRNHFLKIEYKYGATFDAFSGNEIPMAAIKMLFEGIEKDLDFLVEEYEHKPIQSKMSSFELEYKGKQLQLAIRGSKFHLMIWRLIRLHKKLDLVIKHNKVLYICGNAGIDKKILESLEKIRSNFHASGVVSTLGIEEAHLKALIKTNCLLKSGANYSLSLKGLIVDSPE